MRKPSLQTLINSYVPIIDSREQMPYRMANSVVRGLPFGDYSLEYEGRSYQDQIIVERKHHPSELFAASGSQRERFERELQKLSTVPFRYILAEFSFMDIVNMNVPGQLSPSVVYGSIICWHVRFGVPVIFCGNRVNARAYLIKTFQEFVKHKILKP